MHTVSVSVYFFLSAFVFELVAFVDYLSLVFLTGVLMLRDSGWL